MKKILLLGGNYFPEKTGIGRYNGEMMTWLSENGFDCDVITTYPYYPEWKIDSQYNKRKFWYLLEKHGSTNVLRCPLYVPQNPTGIKRILLDLSFTISAFFALFKKLFIVKYDLIIVVVPSFQLGLLAIFYSFFRRTKIVYHIQDMQIEAARDLGMIKSATLIRLLFSIEKFIFRNVDIVSSISQGMISRIQNKAKKSVLFFPNWSDLSLIFPLKNKSDLKVFFGFKADDKIVLYSGAIGEKQGLDVILNIAEKYLNIEDTKFIICGSGPYKQKLITIAEEKKLTNLVFMDLQPKEVFNEFLNMTDVHLVIQKGDASDLVMPSKITNILAAGGLCIVTSNVGTNLHKEMTENEMGIVVEAENENKLFEAVAFSLTGDHERIKGNARRYAEENLNIDNVLARFISEINL